MTPAPEIAVVVPAHGRPLRLRWLLNALEEQTLERDRFEVLIAAEQADLLAIATEHPLGARAVNAPGSGPAARRNAGWRVARAPLVAFTDDDCRPPAEWLERLLGAARPGAIVQGATRPDPDELGLRHGSPHARTQEVVPPTALGQTCNIVYPRALLEELGGFDEAFPLAAGEDTDLMLRARDAGREVLAAPEAVTYHAVEPGSLRGAVAGAWRWRDLPLAVRRHPKLRRELVAGVFWKPSHPRLVLALAGTAVARRRPLLGLALVAPWLVRGLGRYGWTARGVLRAATELPGHTVVDGVEIAAMARGSVRHGTLVL